MENSLDRLACTRVMSFVTLAWHVNSYYDGFFFFLEMLVDWSVDFKLLYVYIMLMKTAHIKNAHLRITQSKIFSLIV